MKTKIPTRIVGVALAVALGAGACSSATPATETPLFDATDPSTEPAPASTVEPAQPTPGPSSTEEAPVYEGIEAAIAALVPTGSPGAIVRIDIQGATVVEAAVGEVAFGSGQPLTAQHPFRIASTTKPVTAATVLRLQEQGQLDIDDLIADYLPDDLVAELHVIDGVSRGHEITIRQLLTHTTGLVDRPFDTPFVDEVGADPDRVWQPRELLEYTMAHAEPLFAPGADYHYSDDGYVLAGLVIEAVTEQPLHEVYRELVLDPLGMDGTYLEGHEAARGLEPSHAYIGGVDSIDIHPSTDWGSGGLVSTAGDLALLGAAIDDGSLFEHPETLEEMLSPDSSGYGLGLYVSPLGNGLTVLAHDGFWGSVMLVIPEIDVVVAATMNQFVAEEEREKFFFDLLGLLEQVLLEQETPRPDSVTTIEVDGRTAAYVSAGVGEPTVVFESGFGDGLESWAATSESAAQFSRVFAYDRAGLGDSDLADEPRDGLRLVDELRSVLSASGHQPPYVLVGHSMGGMYMELFARTYPDEVVGLVLVDATPAGYFERCTASLGAEACEIPFDIDELPEPFRSEALGIPTTEEQVVAAAPLAAIPTVVIVSPQSDGVPETDAIWLEAQRDQAQALDATLVIAEDSGHYIQDDQPDLVLDAIRSLVDEHVGA
ncbi:MAG: class A beta-lactamase-related serine hydrolase [Acidimicrobiia bacterium]|nr:class A beta-lactamase-related serine hydrolase [Acidimicrobiia bacterium]